MNRNSKQLELEGNTGQAVAIPTAEKLAIAQLRSRLKGRVITPEDPDFDQARTVYYGGFDKRPALIARVKNVDDIVTVISLARETGFELAVRSGGHSTAGPIHTC